MQDKDIMDNFKILMLQLKSQSKTIFYRLK